MCPKHRLLSDSSEFVEESKKLRDELLTTANKLEAFSAKLIEHAALLEHRIQTEKDGGERSEQ